MDYAIRPYIYYPMYIYTIYICCIKESSGPA